MGENVDMEIPDVGNIKVKNDIVAVKFLDSFVGSTNVFF